MAKESAAAPTTNQPLLHGFELNISPGSFRYGGSTIRTFETSRTADSEVFHFVEENGRTYHSYKAGP
ncbi:S-adenosyl-L-methionine-dependent methyltransferase [Apiospora marii]|uniref:S-adenosyl-L-methionine-dependent methyltransferase n=1 Tax=Apiospora marii TaxID=335849 RepID=UPI00312D4C29